MNGTKLKKLYLIMPLLYVLFCFSFLFLYLSDRNHGGSPERQRKQKNTVFELSPAALSKLDGKSSAIASASVSGGDITFSFNSKSPLILSTADGKERSLFLRKYQASGGSLDLVFDENFLIHFAPSADIPAGAESRTVISFEIPSAAAAPENISLPVAEGGKLGFLPEIPAVQTGADAKNQTVLYLNKGSLFETANGEDGLLVINSAKASMASIVLETYPAAVDPVIRWFTGDGSYTGAPEYEQAVSEFLDKCYAGLDGDRYSESRQSWRLNPFTEESLVCYAAESMRRGTYEANHEKMQTIDEENRRSLGPAAALYFGDIVKSYADYSKVLDSRRRKYGRMLENNDLGVFAESDIIDVMKDYASASFNELAVKTLTDNYSSWEPESAALAGILEIFTDADQIPSVNAGQVQQYLNLIDGFLLPGISRTGDGLVFGEAPSTLLAVRFGRILLKTGQGLNNDLYLSIGRDLIITALSGADSNGMLPESAGAEQASAADKLAPEFLYKYLAEKFLPRFVQSGNMHIYTIANDISARWSGLKLKIGFDLKAAYTEHILIQGLPSFDSMDMYGQNWNHYSRFQRYDVGGWYYDDDDVLYLKILHKEDTEKIVIKYPPVEDKPEAADAD